MHVHCLRSLLLAGLLAGCAALPPPVPDDAEAAACRERFLVLDRRIDAAGVREAGVHAIAGFPYLRSNRLLASFRGEVKDGAPFAVWVAHLRALDVEARAIELRNLGEPAPEATLAELQRCGRQWAMRDRQDAARRAQLRANAAVPDDYSTVRRALGLYPVAAPIIKSAIRTDQRRIRERYAQPLSSLDAPGRLVLWRPQPAKAVSRREAARWLGKRDALGIPRLSEKQWRQLAATHAPALWIETSGDFDLPGAPQLAEHGLALDAGRPVVYVHRSHTRRAGKVLPQLVYTVWFAGRPADGPLDSYAGVLDGLVWRVTLDHDGRVLLYDSIHPCGCYHHFFPVAKLKPRPQDGFWDEPVLVAQPAPAGGFAIRVQARTHFIRRLAPLKQAAAEERRRYELADYGELLGLPAPGGGTRSLFGQNGIVRGSERFERFWLWPAGVASPGAMRQAGRQATAFVGRRHFDDADLLERIFETPKTEKKAAKKESARKKKKPTKKKPVPAKKKP